jgi:hypothetical protein
MIAHELPRTADFALSDGAKIEFEEKPISRKITSAEVAEFMRRFDADIYAPMGRKRTRSRVFHNSSVSFSERSPPSVNAFGDVHLDKAEIHWQNRSVI